MAHYDSAIATPADQGRYGKITCDVGAVLVVEDEAPIRLNATQMIEDAGYSALETSNADDAIKILSDRRDIRVVFTDVSMCGSRRGLKLAQAIRRRWPPIHLIVASGSPTEFDLPAGSRFIRKPYENSRVVAVRMNSSISN
jgi:CheY-like chemotaxis protein